MEPITNTLSHLKLRMSYGRLGNQSGAALYTFASIMQLSDRLGQYIFPEGRRMYINAPAVINSATTWEKVNSKNIGLDFGLLGNALTGSFDLFERNTSDMLGPSVDYPDYFGAKAPQTNNASLRDRGWELTLNYRGKIGRDIDFQVGGSLSDASTVVTEYANPTGNNPAGSWYKGRRVGEIWGYRVDGIIQTQAEADQYNSTYNTSYFQPSPGNQAT